MNELLYEGKTKSIYSSPEKENYIIRFTDTVTALNGERKEELPGKGQLNAAISNLIYAHLGKHGVKTHFIKQLDETSILVRKAEIIKAECIVRNIAAGSFSKKYGVPEGTKLKNTVVEFSLKNDELNDPMMNESQITAIGLASKQELKGMNRLALRINKLLTILFLKAGIKLIDFKIEFGRCALKTIDADYKSELILCDEISPDSCRLWDADTNERMDKDRFRMDLGGVLNGYRDVLAKLNYACTRRAV